MKRTLITAMAVGASASSVLLGGLTSSASAAPGGEELVTVCQVTGAANSADGDNSFTWYVGHEIQVARNAVTAFERQGDVVKDSLDSSHYITPEHQWWQFLADHDGRLVNADCAFRN